MTTMQAGDLNQRITLQQRNVSIDALGEEVGAWADVAIVWASVKPSRGREYFAAGQMQDPQDVRIRIRHRAGVTELMRAVWRGVPHGINAVIDADGAGVMLELMCTKGLRDGR